MLKMAIALLNYPRPVENDCNSVGYHDSVSAQLELACNARVTLWIRRKNSFDSQIRNGCGSTQYPTHRKFFRNNSR